MAIAANAFEVRDHRACIKGRSVMEGDTLAEGEGDAGVVLFPTLCELGDEGLPIGGFPK